MTSRHTNPAIYAGLAGAAAWAAPTCASALTVLGHDVSLSQPGVSFALGCFVGAAVACGTSAVVTHAAEARRERERAEQAIAEHAAHARQARAAQFQARQAESRAYQAARTANEKLAYAEAMEKRQAEAEAAARQARIACARAGQAKVGPQTTAQFVAAAKQSNAARNAARVAATGSWEQTGNVRVQGVPAARQARPASPSTTAEFIAGIRSNDVPASAAKQAAASQRADAPKRARAQQPQAAAAAQNQAPRYTVPSHYGAPSSSDPNNSGAWAAWQAGANANADYLDVAEAYVNRITLADRMAQRAKGVAGVLSERLGASKMEGLPVIARADGSVGDVGENWWNDAFGKEVRPVGEAVSGLRGVNEAMAENSAVLFTAQTYQQAQAARGAQQARAAQQAAQQAQQGTASATRPAGQQGAAPAARPAGQPQAGACQTTSAQQATQATPQPARVPQGAQPNVAAQQVSRTPQPAQATQTRPQMNPQVAARVPQAPQKASQPVYGRPMPQGQGQANAQAQVKPEASTRPQSAPQAPVQPAAPQKASQQAGQAMVARTDRSSIAQRLGDPNVAFPDKKATRWSDQQQDLWQVALAALDERTNEEIAMRAAAEPVPVTFTPGYDELDEPDHIEPVTQFMAFKPQAGKPDVVDAESYVDMLVDQELANSESPAVRKLARHGIRDFFKVVDGGTHGFRPTNPTRPGHLALQA